MYKLLKSIISFCLVLSIVGTMVLSGYAETVVNPNYSFIGQVAANWAYNQVESYVGTTGADVFARAVNWCTTKVDGVPCYIIYGGGGRTKTQYAGSGATNEYVYNDNSHTNKYSIYNGTGWYNPVTNNYTTYNNTYYNAEYNTYHLINNEYNTYITNNYTYVTYFVTNQETQSTWYYEIYYQLPDGRNSYDLTVDDVWGLALSYDTINYDYVTEDDGVTMRLYHFDGNFLDSSALNGPTLESVTYNFVDSRFLSGINLGAGVSDPLVVSIPTGTQTIEFWVKVSGITSSGGGQVVGRLPVYSDLTNVGTVSASNRKHTPISILTDEWVSVCFQAPVSGNGRWDVFINGVPYAFSGSSTADFKGGNYLYLSRNYDKGLYAYVVYDELRMSNKRLYPVDLYTPSSQPFDTNKVYVLPSGGQEDQIALKSDVPITNVRIGGVRPTYPSTGYVYVFLQNNVVTDIQQFQYDGWYSVDAVIYRNGKWVNLKGQNLSSIIITQPEDPGGGVDPSPSPDPDSGGGLFDGLLSGFISSMFEMLKLIFKLVLQLIGWILWWVTRLVGWMGSYLALPAPVLAVLGVALPLSFVLGLLKFLRG